MDMGGCVGLCQGISSLFQKVSNIYELNHRAGTQGGVHLLQFLTALVLPTGKDVGPWV